MPPDADFFTALLNDEHHILLALHSAMESELEALDQDSLDDLERLRQESAALVQRLQQQSVDRLKWMKEHQLPLSAQCLDTDGLQTLRPLWLQVEAQYQANQRLSTKLSQIVLGVRLRTEQKLKILLGRQNEPYLYNQQGGTNHLHSSHGYAQA